MNKNVNLLFLVFLLSIESSFSEIKLDHFPPLDSNKVEEAFNWRTANLLNNYQSPQTCGNHKLAQHDLKIICKVPPETYDNSYIVRRYPNYAAMPLYLQNKVPPDVKNSINPIYAGINLSNDNIFLFGEANDTGGTHELGAYLKGKVGQKKTWKISFSTGLYTEPTEFKRSILEPGSSFFGINVNNNYYRLINDAQGQNNFYQIANNPSAPLISQEKMKLLCNCDPRNHDTSRSYWFDNNGNIVKEDPKILPTTPTEDNIKFMELNVLGLTLDNYDADSLFIWSGGLSFVNYNTSKINPALATGIQRGWHKFLGGKTIQYNYVSMPQDNNLALILEGTFGVQKKLVPNDHCTLEASAELGGRLANGPYPSFVQGKVNLVFDYHGKKNTYSVNLNIIGIHNKKGSGYKSTVGFSVTFRNENDLKFFTSFVIPGPKDNYSPFHNDANTVGFFGAEVSIFGKNKKIIIPKEN